MTRDWLVPRTYQTKQQPRPKLGAEPLAPIEQALKAEKQPSITIISIIIINILTVGYMYNPYGRLNKELL